MKITRAIISGGGSGGHIFPALAIAQEIKKRNPEAAILFVGALGKMEMEKIPAAGFDIVGLPIVGFQRSFTFKNFLLPFKIISSMLKARKVLKKFKPEVVVGVGGYASGPTLKVAASLGIPCVIQEQNSFPGKTNRLLASKVAKICGAYEGLERFFPAEKIVLTGNPVRSEMVAIEGKRAEALHHFEFVDTKKTLFIVGGSLGARTLNQSVLANLDVLLANDIQVIWQCGKFYSEQIKNETDWTKYPNIRVLDFIARMDLAYAAADLIVSRAGAISISELCLIQKPIILVPSPNVAEDHQTKNAQALVQKNAAYLVKDVDAVETLIPSAIDLLSSTEKCAELAKNIGSMAEAHANEKIVDELEKIAKN